MKRRVAFHVGARFAAASGNAEVNNLDDGAGTMEAVYFGNAKGGLNHGGAGKGPWIMAGKIICAHDPLSSVPLH